MPVIEAKRDGRCAACGQGIVQGERIDYEREVGPRHLACVDRPAEARRNKYRARCRWCGSWVRAGEGELKVVATQQPDGSWRRVSFVACLDSSACSRRCSRSVVSGFPAYRRH